jgi:TolA-binding protein
MALTDTETVGIGTLIGGVITIIIAFLRNMGRRTDPQLIELMSQVVNAHTEATEANKLLSGSIDRISTVLENFSGAVATELQSLTSIVNQSAQQVQSLDDTMNAQTDNTPLLTEVRDTLNQLSIQIAEFIESQKAIDDRRDLEDTRRNEQVETIQKELEGVKENVSQIEKNATAEVPAVDLGASVRTTVITSPEEKATVEQLTIDGKSKPKTPPAKTVSKTGARRNPPAPESKGETL